MTNRLSILSNASKLDVVTEPYPHIIIRNALDPEVFQQLADEYRQDGKQSLFENLQDSISSGNHVPYAELAERMVMSVGAIKVAVHRLRKRYASRLRQLVADTICSPVSDGESETAGSSLSTVSEQEIDRELRDLFSAFED